MAGGSRSELGSSRGDDTVRRLGRYQIIGRLATGGMAEVYLALSGELPGFRTLVVVKRILPHLASNAQFIRMFLDEARLAALLDHPNIVRIIEVGHDGEEYFLAMELVQGKPLSGGAAQGGARAPAAQPGADVRTSSAQAASGLAYAHTLTDGDGRPLGVVHRDVSPQNVLISFEGAVKMIDFGVARAFGRVAHTSPGGLKGKIDYMSPEQASAEEVDHRADVFALGVVLWEALTGRRLFRRETELATMRAIVDDPIPHPSEIGRASRRSWTRSSCARCASARTRASRAPRRWRSALERFAFSQRRLLADAGRRLHEVAVRAPSTCSGERPPPRRWTWRWRSRDRRPGDGGHRRRTADRRADDGVARRASPWSDGRSELRSARRSRSAQPQQPASQGHGQGRGRSQQRVAATRARPAARRPRPAPARRPAKRDRTWLYAVVGALLAIGGGGAWMLTRHQEVAGRRQPGRARARGAPGRDAAGRHRLGSRRAAAPPSRRSRARPRRPAAPAGDRRPSCRPRRRRSPGAPRARARLRVVEGAVPVRRNPSPSDGHRARARRGAPKPPAATTTRTRRRRSVESPKADPFAD